MKASNCCAWWHRGMRGGQPARCGISLARAFPDCLSYRVPGRRGLPAPVAYMPVRLRLLRLPPRRPPAQVPGRLIRAGSPPSARSRPEVMAAVPAILGPVPQSWPRFSGRQPALLAWLNPDKPRTPCPQTGRLGLPVPPPWGIGVDRLWVMLGTWVGHTYSVSGREMLIPERVEEAGRRTD